jgi:tetratricopeptide (TPR) repeat protein
MRVLHLLLKSGSNVFKVECYQRAVQLDQYFAVAYFQQGVSNFLMGDFEEAMANFNDTLIYLRGNRDIDYDQLGLKFKLYSCETLFNRGLCYIYLQQKEAGLQDLKFAAQEKVVPDHDVIDEAIREQAEVRIISLSILQRRLIGFRAIPFSLSLWESYIDLMRRK